MTFLQGENINLGIAKEASRGTLATPSTWIPARTPTGIAPVVEETIIRETRGTSISSQGVSITQERAEGDLEFNLRSNSIGLLLLSLLGSVSSEETSDDGVYEHTFNVLTGNPQYPTLSLALSQLGQQDYAYTNALVSSLEVRLPLDDLANATAQFIAASESAQSDYTPAFASNDHYFRHYDATVKIAENVTALNAAPALSVKEFSNSIVNNARVNQYIGNQNPSDVLAMILEITGSLSVDYAGETFHDLYTNKGSRALQIELKRSDITIGSNSNPTITFVYPNVTISNRTQDRPLDELVTESLDFQAHFDSTAGKAIEVKLINEQVSY